MPAGAHMRYTTHNYLEIYQSVARIHKTTAAFGISGYYSENGVDMEKYFEKHVKVVD